VFKGQLEKYNFSAERQGVAMLFDDKISPEEMFTEYIINEIMPAEKQIIQKYYSPVPEQKESISGIELLQKDFAAWCRKNPYCTQSLKNKKKNELYSKYGIDQFKQLRQRIRELTRILTYEPAMAAADGGQLIPVTYYTSMPSEITWKQMRETEVEDRQNYTLKQFDKIAKKYAINEDDRVIWVSPNKTVAVSYAALADERNNVLNLSGTKLDEYMHQHGIFLNEFKSNDGILLKETDDGDEGFIFLLIRNKLKNGGIVKGKLHTEGGEKFKLKNTDTVVELEADEGVINRRSMLSREKMTVTGTPCEIASKINQVGGGVKFNCS